MSLQKKIEFPPAAFHHMMHSDRCSPAFFTNVETRILLH